MSTYVDGRDDCGITKCPLYPWMPYAALPPDLEWMDYNPKRVGKVRWEDSGREITDEDREAAAHRLSVARTRFKKKRETAYDDILGRSDEDDE